MPAAAIVTIICAVLTVLVLAGYLISIAVVLSRVAAQLREVVNGLHVVPERTEPIRSIIGEINNDLAGVDDALRRVLARK